MFRNGRLLKKQVSSITKVLSSSSASGKNKEQADVFNLIPPRIDRSPTDILKALSNTVGRDPTAFHYQIPDDPLFYPLSNFQKKKRILALESGKKSARWIVQNNSGFFNVSLAEPSIKTFLNKPFFNENSEVTEETLLTLIQDRNVSQAITVFNLLKNKGKDVSKDTRQSLLELVCFYNSKDRPDEKDIWGKWYEVDKKKKNVWTDEGFVRKLFDSLESESPLAYAAMIQGMLKHDNLEEAMELFAAGREKKIEFPVGVYNLLLENVPVLEKDPFKILHAIEDYLTQMAERKIKPNLGTLNSILSALSRIDEISVSAKESFICKLLADFKNLKIDPSLGSYFYILKIFVDQRDVPEMRFGVAWSVMDFIGRKRWTIQHPSDLIFLHSAMAMFCNALKSAKLAHSLMKFYSSHDHYKFLNTNFGESTFLENYISITFAQESAEESMKVYRNLVPSQIFLDFRKYWVIIKVIIQQKKFEYLEEIWKDLCKYCSNQISRMSRIISLVLSPVSLFKKEETPKFFYEVAEVLFSVLNTAELEPSALGNMLITFVRFEDEKKASDVMNFIIDGQILFIEYIPVNEVFAFALSKKNIPLIKNCLELSHRENDPELKTMAKEALPLLDETDQSWLNKILMKKVKEQNKLTVEKPKMDPENA